MPLPPQPPNHNPRSRNFTPPPRNPDNLGPPNLAEEIERPPYKPANKLSVHAIMSNLITLHKMTSKYADRDMYVINNSKEILNTNMPVWISIYGADGTETILTIPKTWIPVNLTEMASNSDLFSSSALRKATTERRLLVVDPDFAEAMLLTPAAIAENNKNLKNTKANKDLINYGELLNGKDTSQPIEYGSTAQKIPKELEETIDIRPEIVAAVQNNDIPVLISTLTMAYINDDLTEKEHNFVLGKVKHEEVLRLLRDGVE
jgi:hypothetical protein